jgi:hypothetical protein
MKDDGPGESVDDLRRQFEGLLELVARYQQKDRAMLERERTVSAAEAMVRDRLAALVPREAELAQREADLARREALQVEREAAFMAVMEPHVKEDRGTILWPVAPPGESPATSIEILKRRLVVHIREKLACLAQLRDLQEKMAEAEKNAQQNADANAALRSQVSRLEQALQTTASIPWLSAEQLEFLSTTEATPEEVFKPMSRVVTIGSGPYPRERFDEYLQACQIEPCENGASWVVVGRDGWSSERLHELAAYSQRIFSQELFALAMITGRDPFDWPARVLFPFASGHPALESLGVAYGIWPEWIEEHDQQEEEEADPDNEMESREEQADEDAGDAAEFTDENSGDQAAEGLDAADDNEPLIVPACLGGSLGMVDQSPLNALGYQVGAKRGLSETDRRAILQLAYQGQIPATGYPVYMMEWGLPWTPKRLWRIAHHLASLVRLQSTKHSMWQAVSDWRSDLAWLRKTFYDAACQSRFQWPEE